jgi:hypothetical protein
MSMVPVNPVGIRTEARQDARSRRPANRLLAIRPLKQKTTRRQPINIRTLHMTRPIAPQLRTHVIHRNHHDIQWFAKHPPDQHSSKYQFAQNHLSKMLLTHHFNNANKLVCFTHHLFSAN